MHLNEIYDLKIECFLKINFLLKDTKPCLYVCLVVWHHVCLTKERDFLFIDVWTQKHVCGWVMNYRAVDRSILASVQAPFQLKIERRRNKKNKSQEKSQWKKSDLKSLYSVFAVDCLWRDCISYPAEPPKRVFTLFMCSLLQSRIAHSWEKLSEIWNFILENDTVTTNQKNITSQKSSFSKIRRELCSASSCSSCQHKHRWVFMPVSKKMTELTSFPCKEH